MKKLIESSIAAMADHMQFLDLYASIRRQVTNSQVAVLLYHTIHSIREMWFTDVNALNPQQFETQIAYLCRNFEILSLDVIAQYIHQQRTLPQKAVAITFDDGYSDNYHNAFPILKKYSIPATIFLLVGHIEKDNLFWWDKISYAIHYAQVTQLSIKGLGSYSLRSNAEKAKATISIVGHLRQISEAEKNRIVDSIMALCQTEIPDGLAKRLILSWDQVKEMSDAGISFGAHTMNHPILTRLSVEQAREQICDSKRIIEEKLGRNITSFSYPNGKTGDYNETVVKMVERAGFECAVTVIPRLVSPTVSPYQIGRMGDLNDLSRLKVMLSGLWGDLPRMFRQGDKYRNP
jgi:peptidoglycan/xylan/chitin deacetylase (PgdA/CDA1 family)